MFNLKAEPIYEGMTHKGLKSAWNGQIKTACGKTLAEKTYRATNPWFYGNYDCPGCLSVRR